MNLFVLVKLFNVWTSAASKGLKKHLRRKACCKLITNILLFLIILSKTVIKIGGKKNHNKIQETTLNNSEFEFKWKIHF